MSEISHHLRAGTGVETHLLGARIAAHVHDDDQIVYVSAGSLTIATDRGTWIASSDRAVLVPAGVVHRYQVHSRTRLHTVGVGDRSGPAGRPPKVFAVSPLLRELLLALSGRRLDADAAPAGTVLLLALTDATPAVGIHLPRAREPRVLAACRTVEEDLGCLLPLAELADSVGVSTRTLSRLYRTEFGMTYPQWRTRLRVHHAALALLRGDAATRVAAEHGWATPSAFTSAFATLMGITPSAYQRRAAAVQAEAGSMGRPRPLDGDDDWVA